MARNDEARIQAAIVDWARLVAPDAIIYAVPNGGLRTKAEAARMKWTGTLAGVPDLAIIAPGGMARFLEVKAGAGRLSPEQAALIARLRDVGACVAVVRSIDEARAAFRAWGIATKEAGQ